MEGAMVRILSESAQPGQDGGATRQDRNAWLIGLGVDPAVLRGAAATPGGGPQARPASTPYTDYSEAAVAAAAADGPPATAPATAYESPVPDRSDAPPAGGPQARPARTPYTDYSEAAVAAAAADGPPATAPATAYESPELDRSDEPPADGPQARLAVPDSAPVST